MHLQHIAATVTAIMSNGIITIKFNFPALIATLFPHYRECATPCTLDAKTSHDCTQPKLSLADESVRLNLGKSQLRKATTAQAFNETYLRKPPMNKLINLKV
ncbi:hypothetical protein H0G86_012147 [Trichoderma simmonsii]|uniref:Uncharacterized protein n=1 Tax=Trichoderma simmonsii TaxID=1491479 RepID=A0A8G0LPU5_9HYPO|nr:hypothetical protein H0G86_012147 [Trichoderma simmonsii]